MRVSDFDFELPEKLIAKSPLAERDASRLLCLSRDGYSDENIRFLPSLVRPGDVWVLNDTRVIPARLNGYKQTGGKVEFLLIEPAAEGEWLAWGKSNKPLKPGEVVAIADDFKVEVLSREGKQLVIRLLADDVGRALEQYGHMPLPPYIDRPDSAEDKERYQTVFARHEGAVAAPTAGLHLTDALMEKMREAGAEFVSVTLHVGPGTFQPVQVDEIGDHVMHEERFLISPQAAETINRAKAAGRRIVAVGTTSLRALEAAAGDKGVAAGESRTDIFIYPGYQFKVVDALLTNFHLPKSTLLMLVSALAGRQRVMAAYEHAKAEGYRFYSYGDAMFISDFFGVDSGM